MGQTGISVAIGLGSGRLTQDCSYCTRSVSESSTAWMARLGYANTAHSVVGVEFDRWKTERESEGVEFSRTNTWIDLSAQWYPSALGWARGFYVKGLLGLATFDSHPGSAKSRSIGGGGGIGYDLTIVPGIALTPYFDVLASQDGDAKLLTRDRAGRIEQTHASFSALMSTFGLALRLQRLP